MKKYLNILYIHSHDTGRFIQPYGYAIETPNLQKLAEQGVLFRKAFTPSPTCSPSRACLLSGEYPHQNGMLGLAHRGFSMNYAHHLVNTLKQHGYITALSGVQHVTKGDQPFERERVSNPWKTIGYDLGLTTVHAEAHIKAVEFLENPPEQPFFLSVGFYETHRNFPEAHPQDDARYVMPPPPLPDTSETREDMARFKESARILDRKIGLVLDALERSGHAENTLVICTTDHGIAFPRMKCNLEDSGTGIMLIMRGPGGFTGGKVIDAMISHIDVFPTLCDLLEIDKPDWLEGQSFLPLIGGEAAKNCDELFFEINYHAAFEPMRAVRTDRYKYIVRYDSRNAPVLPNCDAGLSKTVWLNHGWAGRAPVDEVLYDLIFDPNEMCNRINDPSYADIRNDMKRRLSQWQLRTKDPLFTDGAIPLPSTAICDPRDETDPDVRLLPEGVR